MCFPLCYLSWLNLCGVFFFVVWFVLFFSGLCFYISDFKPHKKWLQEQSLIWQCGQVVLFSCETLYIAALQLKLFLWGLCWEKALVRSLSGTQILGRRRVFSHPRAVERAVLWVALTTAGNNREPDSLELLHLESPKSWTVVEQTLLYLFLETWWSWNSKTLIGTKHWDTWHTWICFYQDETRINKRYILLAEWTCMDPTEGQTSRHTSLDHEK